MDIKVKPPVITGELIAYLESRFLDMVPSIHHSDREIWYNAGAVAVVRHLKQCKRQQEANILNKELL